MIQILNFSGGKDSTAMLHLMLERGEQIDDVIYFNGGWDFPQMAEHMKQVEIKTGLKITELKPERGFDYLFFNHEFVSAKYGLTIGYGWPAANARWCTRQKVDYIKNYIKGRFLFRDVVQCCGFAVGEERRAERPGVSSGFRFPLIEYNFDEVDCLQYCKKLGYNWGGLYEYFDRVSCFCCPLQSKRDLLILKRHFPELWEKMLEKDQRLLEVRAGCGRSFGSKFKPDYYLIEIDSQIRTNEAKLK